MENNNGHEIEEGVLIVVDEDEAKELGLTAIEDGEE